MHLSYCGFIEEDNKLSKEKDVFTLIDLFITKEKGKEHLDFLINSFDCFDNDKKSLFNDSLSYESLVNKVRLFDNRNNVDILDDCLHNYFDVSKNTISFPVGRFILLYAFLIYLLNKEKISKEEFSTRIRIINNLVINSISELKEGFNKDIKRINIILKETNSIILNGEFIEDEEFFNNGFNAVQYEEEIEKSKWRENNTSLIDKLNLLENHDLLKGQIKVVGFSKIGENNSSIFDKFYDLFNLDLDLVSCALLTFGDYSKKENNWRYQYGVSGEKSKEVWTSILHPKNHLSFDNTRDTLYKLLSSMKEITTESLKLRCDEYLKECEKNSTYFFEYYYIKYKEFRPNIYGKYWIEKDRYKY